jgi:hypothetical protein
VDLADVSKSELSEMSELIGIRFARIRLELLPPVTLLHGILDVHRKELDADLRELLERNPEGPGEIVVLKVYGSQQHLNVVKITSVVGRKGARQHRMTRVANEVPGCKIECLFARQFEHRLEAEEELRRALVNAGYKVEGSKWFRMNVEAAVGFIQRLETL